MIILYFIYLFIFISFACERLLNPANKYIWLSHISIIIILHHNCSNPTNFTFTSNCHIKASSLSHLSLLPLICLRDPFEFIIYIREFNNEIVQ